ncbi:MAG: hypothetical protein ACFBSC_05505 [Microcoleaceae cyanobacterium]
MKRWPRILLTLVSVILIGLITQWRLPQHPAQAQTPEILSSGISLEWIDDRDIEWSVVTQVDDPFEGQYEAIFDRNFWVVNSYFWTGGRDLERQVTTVWSRNFIRVLYSNEYDPPQVNMIRLKSFKPC